MAICTGDPACSATTNEAEQTRRLDDVGESVGDLVGGLVSLTLVGTGAVVFGCVDSPGVEPLDALAFVATGVAVSVATKPVLTTMPSVVKVIRMNSDKVTLAGTLLVTVEIGLPVTIGLLVG